MTDCIFCKIINKEIPSSTVYEDEFTIVIEDINPVAPLHLLVLPKKHYSAVHDVPENETQLLARLMQACRKTIKEQDIAQKGYRLIINSGEDAGQTVPHIHMHILSGRTFSAGMK